MEILKNFFKTIRANKINSTGLGYNIKTKISIVFLDTNYMNNPRN